MTTHLIACPQCDALVEKPIIEEGKKVLCARCHGKIFERKINSIERTLAASIAGLICFIPAAFLPMIGIGTFGIHNESSLIECIVHLIHQDLYIISCCIFLFTIAVPLVQLSIAAYLAWQAKNNTLSRKVIPIFRSYHVLSTWSMLHVFFLGLVVSMYKLLSLAELSVGFGLLGFLLFLMCAIYTSLSLDRDIIWEHLEQNYEY